MDWTGLWQGCFVIQYRQPDYKKRRDVLLMAARVLVSGAQANNIRVATSSSKIFFSVETCQTGAPARRCEEDSGDVTSSRAKPSHPIPSQFQNDPKILKTGFLAHKTGRIIIIIIIIIFSVAVGESSVAFVTE
jgi:hypothetical protein